MTSAIRHLTSDILREQRGRRDGDGLSTCREHRPTVGAAFGDIELLSGFQQVQHGQVVDATLCPLRKTETG